MGDFIPNYHLNTGHLNTRLVKVRYSDASVIQMFVIQIPTELYNLITGAVLVI